MAEDDRNASGVDALEPPWLSPNPSRARRRARARFVSDQEPGVIGGLFMFPFEGLSLIHI